MGGVADSIIIGLFALRFLPAGQRLRRITDSIFIGLFALSIFAGRATRRSKTNHQRMAIDQGQSPSALPENQLNKNKKTKSVDQSSASLLSESVYVGGGRLASPSRAVARPMDLVN